MVLNLVVFLAVSVGVYCLLNRFKIWVRIVVSVSIFTLCSVGFIVMPHMVGDHLREEAITVTNEDIKKEVSQERAIQIALDAAKKESFDVNGKDVEVLRFKSGLERGPMRIVWLRRTIPTTIAEKIEDKEFWVVYLYPYGAMIVPSPLGGDFTAFIDLYDGSVLSTWTGQ